MAVVSCCFIGQLTKERGVGGIEHGQRPETSCGDRAGPLPHMSVAIEVIPARKQYDDAMRKLATC